jgi:hypothetical protein
MEQVDKTVHANIEVQVTVEMVAAEIAEHSFGEEIAYVLECVFRQMLYAGKLSASSSNSERN